MTLPPEHVHVVEAPPPLPARPAAHIPSVQTLAGIEINSRPPQLPVSTRISQKTTTGFPNDEDLMSLRNLHIPVMNENDLNVGSEGGLTVRERFAILATRLAAVFRGLGIVRFVTDLPGLVGRVAMLQKTTDELETSLAYHVKKTRTVAEEATKHALARELGPKLADEISTKVLADLKTNLDSLNQQVSALALAVANAPSPVQAQVDPGLATKIEALTKEVHGFSEMSLKSDEVLDGLATKFGATLQSLSITLRTSETLLQALEKLNAAPPKPALSPVPALAPSPSPGPEFSSTLPPTRISPPEPAITPFSQPLPATVVPSRAVDPSEFAPGAVKTGEELEREFLQPSSEPSSTPGLDALLAANRKPKRRPRWQRLGLAGAALVLIGVGSIYFMRPRTIALTIKEWYLSPNAEKLALVLRQEESMKIEDFTDAGVSQKAKPAPTPPAKPAPPVEPAKDQVPQPLLTKGQPSVREQTGADASERKKKTAPVPVPPKPTEKPKVPKKETPDTKEASDEHRPPILDTLEKFARRNRVKELITTDQAKQPNRDGSRSGVKVIHKGLGRPVVPATVATDEVPDVKPITPDAGRPPALKTPEPTPEPKEEKKEEKQACRLVLDGKCYK